MSLVVSLWRRGRRRYGLPVMLIGAALVILAVYDGVTGPYPLASLEPMGRSILGRRARAAPAPDFTTRGQRPHGMEEEMGMPADAPPAVEEVEVEVKPVIENPENQRARPEQGADVSHLAGVHSNDLTRHASIEIFPSKDCTGSALTITAHRTEHKCTRCFDACRANYADGTATLNRISSFRVLYTGDGPMPAEWSVSSFNVCGGTFAYSAADMDKATIGDSYRPESGCVKTGEHPNMLRFDGLPDPDEIYDAQTYRVVYSVESSTYFAYQSYANLYAFEHSNQQQSPPAAYTRLLTSSEEDDLSVANGGKIPTFTSPREPFSRSYSPYNKPTSLTAYMESDVSPTEEVIVIIDPDNWLVQNIGPIAAKVRPGQAVATAAFYDGNPLVTDLYQKHICKNACDFIPDTVAVPYFVHREDAKKIAPLWKELTKKVFELFKDPVHAATYQSLQPGWCAEMYGYVFAAAELRVKHTILPNLQHRDVDGKITWDEAMKRRIRMIHMGRAWFAKDWATQHAARWVHRPAWEYSPPNTEQVWCKCNQTAADERPWPMPPNIDFTSNVTLTLLHQSELEYGNAPMNKFRRGYSGTYP